jgi:hypothetical protein
MCDSKVAYLLGNTHGAVGRFAYPNIFNVCVNRPDFGDLGEMLVLPTLWLMLLFPEISALRALSASPGEFPF